ncbi:YjbH domain-containing protein [Vibrio scophthalmi]|uniref:Putative lipoprotein GfcD n=1 Tax=Vibrio scophthalmi TaxID=45658 RepID=A0A1C7FCG1_9VIBR|nr:YjbH domain-containing protein [Vibrio scophthalmi]ANU37660.1 putative lipoprotein GfcD [Vibrio scophthalmi]
MKIRKLPLLLSSFGLLSVPSFASNATWQVSQTDFGGTGLIQTPSGRMAQEGEFNVGVSVNDDYHQYSTSLQLMSWLETTIRYTRVPDTYYSDDPAYSGDNIYTDKGIDFKIRLLEESYWLPETSVGVRDFGGTGLFDAEYLAATKRFGNLDFTLGLGWGYLGQSGTVTNPFCKASDKYCTRPSDFKGTGGSVDFERWFKGPAALFGGIEYQTPYDPLRIKIEYEGNDYSEDFPVGRGKAMPQHTPINVGVNYRLGDWGDAKLSYQRGDTLTLGFNLYTNFNDMKAIWRDEPKQTVQLSTAQQKSDTDWQDVANQLETNAGYKQSTLSKQETTLVLTGEQKKYRDRNEALDRAAAILTNHSDESVEQFIVVENQDGLPLTETIIDRSEYVAASHHMAINANVAESMTQGEPSNHSSTMLASTKERWGYGIDPVLKQSFGAPEAFYLYSVGLNAKSNYWLTDNVELAGSVYFNLFDNYDKFNYVENSPHVRNYATPRVRTMFRAYVEEPVRLNRLQLTWFEQPAESIYTQVYAGYLESMFAGVGSEVLYRPYGKNWAVGLDANLISQRDPNSWFGVYSEDYFFYNESTCNTPTPKCQAYVLSKGSTGHLTGYYMPQWQFLDSTLFKVSAGKFLGGDVGARVDFSKQFKSGVIVGAYATLTDLTAEEYGEGSYNKGFYVSVPLDLMTVKPSTSRARISWQPITRDGGQMLNKQHYLFYKTDARSQWSQRPSSVSK